MILPLVKLRYEWVSLFSERWRKRLPKCHLKLQARVSISTAASRRPRRILYYIHFSCFKRLLEKMMTSVLMLIALTWRQWRWLLLESLIVFQMLLHADAQGSKASLMCRTASSPKQNTDFSLQVQFCLALQRFVFPKMLTERFPQTFRHVLRKSGVKSFTRNSVLLWENSRAAGIFNVYVKINANEWKNKYLLFDKGIASISIPWSHHRPVYCSIPSHTGSQSFIRWWSFMLLSVQDRIL